MTSVSINTIMKIAGNTHLTYCTNIHPGESWDAVFKTLKQYLPEIKQHIVPNEPLGIGLRLSNQAAIELAAGNHLPLFKDWLKNNGLYVFTMNGFPYGGFHGTRVKDKVHQPDWQTNERVDYTILLFQLLSELLPKDQQGGISTSPLSYKHWLTNDDARKEALATSTHHILQVVEFLYDTYQKSGKLLHLDIEPEPDGLIENTHETIDWYTNWLLPQAHSYFKGKIGSSEIETIVLRHMNVCYDICHFAVEYEEPAWVFDQFTKYGIQIGKIQISAALKADLPTIVEERNDIYEAFSQFNESTYLHQVIALSHDGKKTNFNDLPEALKHIKQPSFAEWRTHFHVPIFVEDYGLLTSTQSDIKKVLDLQRIKPITQHLEIETYTWEVLPADLQLGLQQSIEREMEWVIGRMRN